MAALPEPRTWETVKTEKKKHFGDQVKGYSNLYTADPDTTYLGCAYVLYSKYLEFEPSKKEQEDLLKSLSPKVKETIEQYAPLTLEKAIVAIITASPQKQNSGGHSHWLNVQCQ